MDDTQMVATVRRFNRVVTERIGALEDHYLDRGRPMGASRVLWEIPDTGVDVRSLRTRLGLDSGYMSRILRSLEEEGLLKVAVDPSDQRVRVATVTAAGRRERDELNRLSDELALSILAPLGPERAGQMVEAMATVRRLLITGMVEIGPEDPATDDARSCIRAYFAELDERFDAGFDPAASLPADAHELRPPEGLLLLARLHGVPVGCGALKFHGDDPAELKRMWTSNEVRGLGLGRMMLAELEEAARDRGVRLVRLETNRTLTEAISLYRSAGYVEVPRFNHEPYAHHWFEKTLVSDR